MPFVKEISWNSLYLTGWKHYLTTKLLDHGIRVLQLLYHLICKNVSSTYFRTIEARPPECASFPFERMLKAGKLAINRPKTNISTPNSELNSQTCVHWNLEIDLNFWHLRFAFFSFFGVWLGKYCSEIQCFFNHRMPANQRQTNKKSKMVICWCIFRFTFFFIFFLNLHIAFNFPRRVDPILKKKSTHELSTYGCQYVFSRFTNVSAFDGPTDENSIFNWKWLVAVPVFFLVPSFSLFFPRSQSLFNWIRKCIGRLNGHNFAYL